MPRKLQCSRTVSVAVCKKRGVVEWFICCERQGKSNVLKYWKSFSGRRDAHHWCHSSGNKSKKLNRRIFVSAHGKGLMDERQIENDCIKPLELWDLNESPALTEIPIQFVTDWPRSIFTKSNRNIP